MGKSLNMACKSFGNSEKRSSCKDVLKECYTADMGVYNNLCHRTHIQKFINFRSGKLLEHNINFLSHHGVFREESQTTKLWEVFDASATGGI